MKAFAFLLRICGVLLSRASGSPAASTSMCCVRALWAMPTRSRIERRHTPGSSARGAFNGPRVLSRHGRWRLPAVSLRFATIALAFAFVLSGTVQAHSELIDVVPAEGAVLASPPPVITLTFNEPVAPLVVRLVGPGGSQVDVGAPEVLDTTLTLMLPSGLAHGGYLFSWRIASADGHPVGGTLSFAIGDADNSPAASVSDLAPWLAAAIVLVGLGLLAGLLFGVGGVAFEAWAAEYEAGGCRRHLPALLLALIAAPVSLGLQGLDALGAPWSALFTRPCWAAAMSTSYGTLVLLAEAAALVGLFACVTGSARWRRALALLSLLLLGLALASSGHAAMATGGSAPRVVVFLHAVAAASWLGALACLPFLMLGGYGETALRRFSAAAVIIVTLLAATGLLLAWWQLRQPTDLWRTAYGRILSAKLVFVLCLLALAAVNRWRLTGPALRGDSRASRTLLRNIRWEIAFAVAILCAVALWRFTPPPRALPPEHVAAARMEEAAHRGNMAQEGNMADMGDMAHMGSMAHTGSVARTSGASALDHAMSPDRVTVSLHGGGADAQALVTVRPDGRAGVTLGLSRGDGSPLQPTEVSVTFSNPRAGVEGIVRSAHRDARGADGTWIVDDVPLLISGLWDIKVDALISDFESISLQGQGDFQLGGPPRR